MAADSKHRKERVETAIMGYVREQFMNATDPEKVVAPETHLFQEGIVDSIGVLLLVRFVEEHFGFSVRPADLVLEHFSSVRAMRDFVVARISHGEL
ncbi:MAG: acyl carrier protein [Acidobacteriota bacterium]